MCHCTIYAIFAYSSPFGEINNVAGKRMSQKLNQIIYLLKGYLGVFLGIALGVFLFILFFQPFPLDRFDFNNKLTFVAGLAAIIFLLMAMVKIGSMYLFHENEPSYQRPVWSEFLNGFSIFALGAVAFAFYLRYVGKVDISFQLMIRVLLISLAAAIILRMYDMINTLRQGAASMLQEKRALQRQLELFEEHYYNKSVEFVSENSTEAFKLMISEVAFIRSADNYVEIVYREDAVFKKKLIRNTMKGIELQVNPFPNFVRCHRVCIVNTVFIEKLNKGHDNFWITIRGYEEKIPVSRQNILKIKELI